MRRGEGRRVCSVRGMLCTGLCLYVMELDVGTLWRFSALLPALQPSLPALHPSLPAISACPAPTHLCLPSACHLCLPYTQLLTGHPPTPLAAR